MLATTAAKAKEEEEEAKDEVDGSGSRPGSQAAETQTDGPRPTGPDRADTQVSIARSGMGT